MPRGPLFEKGDEAKREKWCKQQLKDEDYGRTFTFLR